MNWETRTRLMGEHSNIPACCIQAFIEGRSWDNKRERGVGYVRCESCIKAGKVNLVHICSARCISYLQSVGLSWKGYARRQEQEAAV